MRSKTRLSLGCDERSIGYESVSTRVADSLEVIPQIADSAHFTHSVCFVRNDYTGWGLKLTPELAHHPRQERGGIAQN